MTQATNNLIDELCAILDANKYLLLFGGSAVGKTYVATLIAENSRKELYNKQGTIEKGTEFQIETEIVPIHPAYTYEDFVSGISFNTLDGCFSYEYHDKIFMKILRKANNSWKKHEAKKYFLILDDIGRGNISGILGDVLPLLEPHGSNGYLISPKTGEVLKITPNLYIIATKSSVVSPVDGFNYAFYRHFYQRCIESDFRYIDDQATSVYSDYDISENAMFYRCKRIVLENLRHRYQLPLADRDKYVIGHGIFNNASSSLVMRYKVIPLLLQYVKDGVLDKSALISIEMIKHLFNGQYSKDQSDAETRLITGFITGISPTKYYAEDTTHKPIVNLVCRIKEQGLLSDTEIADTILFNKGVLIRKSAGATGPTYQAPAYLYVERSKRDIYTYTKSNRYLYSAQKKDGLTINGIEYAAAAEMQPKEYTRWSEELNSDDLINERYSSSPNSTMFRIIRSYYIGLQKKYEEYLKEVPADTNVKLLKAFVESEFGLFIQFVMGIGSGSDEADVNKERNRQFRERISQLILLWKNIGDTIYWNGQTIKIEGVYKVDTVAKYNEYSKAMDTLGIHQMIMQGPPGTSKTYSAREFLRYMAVGNTGKAITDAELDKLQIKDFNNESSLTEWSCENPGSAPSIAWDIVQFHPSYGYEDFVRGIEVSTIEDVKSHTSAISYETVDKILGKMADAASRKGFENTKFILVIDEINRTNLATVFGELIYGLEYRGKSVATPYTVKRSNKIQLPDNLYIIGTMNTADKSIGGIDYAIRRRFLFFSLLPDRNVILNYGINGSMGDAEKMAQSEINQKAVKLFDIVEQLFDTGNLSTEYYKDDVQIGHTYFLVASEEQLYLRFKYQILPILREYFKDGMFQFEEFENTEDGSKEFMECVSGISAINDDVKLRLVFNKLLKDR